MNGPTDVDSLVLQLLIQEIGSSWRKVEFHSNIEPISFFHAASLYCPLLTDVTLHRCHSQRDMSDSVVQLFRPIPSVTTLRLDHCVFHPALPILFRIFPGLRELTIEANDLASNRDLCTILRNAPELKRLILRNSTPIPGTHLISYLRERTGEQGQQSLEWLDINDFALENEGMLLLMDTMQSGILKCYNEKFVMDRQIDRKKLKEMFDKKQLALRLEIDRQLQQQLQAQQLLQRQFLLQQQQQQQQMEQERQQRQQMQRQMLQQARQWHQQRQEQLLAGRQIQQHQEEGRQIFFYDLTLDDDEQQEEVEEEDDD